MKLVKPDKLSVLFRCVEHDGCPRLLVAAIAGFSFERPKSLVPEIQLWPMTVEALASEKGVLDEGMAKVRGELLVTGSCYVPRGEPAQVSFVRVQCGAIDKRLAVIGDRHWKHGVPTEPAPFTVMPIDWEHAFGGAGFARNPLGRGYGPVEQGAVKVHPLPNIEVPKRLISSPSDRPEPAGLGALDFSWPQRFTKAGTYDLKWLETRAFGFPADIDPTIFNLAQDDQWLAGYFSGDESFVVENMHPTRSRIEGTLPPLRPRVLVTQRQPDGGELFKEIAVRLETVRLFPALELGVLIFRGSMEVYDDDAGDIRELLIAGEDRELPERTVDHYHLAIRERRIHGKAGLMALSDKDLMPPREAGWVTRMLPNEVDKLIEAEHLLQKNMLRRKTKELLKTRAELVAAGLDPNDYGIDKLLEQPPPPVDPTDVDAVADELEKAEEELLDMRRQAEEKRAEIEARSRQAFVDQGMDFDAAVDKAKREAAGPPKFDARRQLEQIAALLAISRAHDQPLEEMERMIADEGYRQELYEGEAKLKELYRRSAHLRDPAAPVEDGASEMFRAELQVAHANEIALEARDYTGADLSGTVLPGIDLCGAFLESVNATDADWRGGKLDDVVLSHATLTGTTLAGASLLRANLGGARLDAADLSGSNLDEAVLHRATIERSSLRGAHMHKTNLHETVIGAGVDMSEVDAEMLTFFRVDLRGVRFAGARVFKCLFIECDVRGVDFGGADLSRSLFMTCPADGARFAGARLMATKFVQETTLVDAIFTGAQMPQAHLRGLDLRRACFDGALLDSADLSKSNLTEASLRGIRGRNAMFIGARLIAARLTRADLLGALLTNAKLQGAWLEEANLFGTDLAKIQTDANTKLDRANVDRARIHPRAKAKKPPLPEAPPAST